MFLEKCLIPKHSFYSVLCFHIVFYKRYVIVVYNHVIWLSYICVKHTFHGLVKGQNLNSFCKLKNLNVENNMANGH